MITLIAIVIIAASMMVYNLRNEEIDVKLPQIKLLEKLKKTKEHYD